MNNRPAVNRRALMKGMAGTAVVPGTLAMTMQADGAAVVAPEVTVAVTVVRAAHSSAAPDDLRIGVRASIRSASLSRDGLVLVIEPVRFGVSSAEAGIQIAKGVRAQVADLLARKGDAVNPERIAVQVFGGVL